MHSATCSGPSQTPHVPSLPPGAAGLVTGPSLGCEPSSQLASVRREETGFSPGARRPDGQPAGRSMGRFLAKVGHGCFRKNHVGRGLRHQMLNPRT